MILRPEHLPRNHWISLGLAGTKSNRLALNARVRIVAGSLIQTDEVRSGGSYMSQNDLRLHFGLGDQMRADEIEITWPSGEKEAFTNLSADHFYCVQEGAAPAPCKPLRSNKPPLNLSAK
jgi:hypothetical protein